jgi:hypothetical protein
MDSWTPPGNEVAPPPPAAGATPAGRGSGPTSPLPLRERRWFLPVVAIVVAAIVVIAVLAVASSLAPKAKPATTEPFATFDEAQSVAGPVAAHAAAGSWSAVVAAGVRIGSALSIPTSGVSGIANFSANCTPEFFPGLPSQVTVDATPPSAGPGHAAFWLIGFSNGGGGLLFVTVNLGVPLAVFSLNFSACLSPSPNLVAFPSTEVDSPALVGAANSTGGATYLAMHPSAAQVFGGVGGISEFGVTTSPIWEVVDTSCPLPYPVDENGTAFNATVWGTGSVVTSGSGPVNCAAGLTGSISGVSLFSTGHLGLAQAI